MMLSKVLKEYAKHTLTERDGHSYDFFRGVAVMGALGFIIFTAHDVFWMNHWNPTEYGLGFAAVLGATAAAVRANEGPPIPSVPPVDKEAANV